MAVDNPLCPPSAPFFGFMGAAVALIFASELLSLTLSLNLLHPLCLPTLCDRGCTPMLRHGHCPLPSFASFTCPLASSLHSRRPFLVLPPPTSARAPAGGPAPGTICSDINAHRPCSPVAPQDSVLSAH